MITFNEETTVPFFERFVFVVRHFGVRVSLSAPSEPLKYPGEALYRPLAASATPRPRVAPSYFRPDLIGNAGSWSRPLDGGFSPVVVTGLGDAGYDVMYVLRNNQ